MAVVRTRGSVGTWASMRTQVRSKVGDNNASRYSTTLLNQALNDAMKEIYNTIGRDIGGVLTSADLAYTGESTVLADAYAAAPIYKVEDVSDSNSPRLLDYVSPSEIENYRVESGPTSGNDSLVMPHRRWSLLGESIVVRPSTSLTLRIYYHPASWVVTADVDQHPFSYNFEELLVLGAAMLLTMVDNEPASKALGDRYYKLLADLANKPRISAPRRVGRRGMRF